MAVREANRTVSGSEVMDNCNSDSSTFKLEAPFNRIPFTNALNIFLYTYNISL